MKIPVTSNPHSPTMLDKLSFAMILRPEVTAEPRKSKEECIYQFSVVKMPKAR
jgi:hypothetical protein